MRPEDHRRQAIVSGGVAWLTRMVQAVLSLGAAVVLARLLTPDAFGVFAMVVPVGVIANQLAGQAFQTALLQRRELTDEETSAFFWFAARGNLAIAGAMVVIGFGLAAFYREPRVAAVVLAWAGMTWLLTITTFQEALLKRAMRFPAVMAAQFTGLVMGIACAIFAARAGAGYWALPIQLLVMETVRAAGVAHVSRWTPRRPGAGTPGASELRSAWRSLVGYKLATWVGDQPELMAVGRVGGAHVLGLYDTGRRWAWYPFEESYTILTDVAVAGARVAGDASAIQRFLSHSMLLTLTVSLPVITFVGVTAPDLVPVLLGEQWLNAVPFLRLLCIVAFMGAMSRVCFWLPLASGTPDVLLRWSGFVQAPATVVAVLVGMRWGALGVARAVAVSTTLLVFPCFLVMTRSGPLGLRGLVGAVWRPVVTSLGAGAVVAAVQAGASPWERLILGMGVFVPVFAITWFLLPGGAAQAASMVRNVRTFARPG
jgi:PST family polysaccharide transporter